MGVFVGTKLKKALFGTSKVKSMWVGPDLVWKDSIILTFRSNNTAYGTINAQTLEVPAGSVITTSGNNLTITAGGQTIATVIGTPRTQTAQYTYAFSSWSIASGTTLNDNTTITGTFTQTLRTYTVYIVVGQSGWGTVSSASVTGVPYGTGLTASGNKVTINGTVVTAIPHATTAQYTYAFSAWSNISGSITANRTITANFRRTLRN